jgi:hypothetical protein
MQKNTIGSNTKPQPANTNTRNISSQSGKDGKSSTQSTQDKNVKPGDSKSKNY